jgi:hypothetical protein
VRRTEFLKGRFRVISDTRDGQMRKSLSTVFHTDMSMFFCGISLKYFQMTSASELDGAAGSRQMH